MEYEHLLFGMGTGDWFIFYCLGLTSIKILYPSEDDWCKGRIERIDAVIFIARYESRFSDYDVTKQKYYKANQ